MPYRHIVTERIINKLKLGHTYYGMKLGFQPGEAISYHYANNEWKQDKAAYLNNFSGAGAIISTPSDMLKFINALFAGWLISKRSLDTMKTIRDGYGMGLFPYGNEKYGGFGHNGKTEASVLRCNITLIRSWPLPIAPMVKCTQKQKSWMIY